jgi:PKD repeat protein
VALAAVCGLPASAAASPTHFIGKPSGLDIKRGSRAPGSAKVPPGAKPLIKPLVSCPQPAPSPSCNLTYHGGSVVHTNETHLIFWAPGGYSVSANYLGLTEQYLGDVAADSGRATNPYAVDTQYTDAGGNISYSQTYGEETTDTDAFPTAATGCTLQGVSTACLTETQEAKELDGFLKAKGLPTGLGNIYFLVLPEKVQTCFDDFSACGPYGPGVPDSSGNTSEYCAYHTSFDLTNGLTLWANMPDGSVSGCNVINSPPNGPADTLIDSLSHEHNETITDPNLDAWYDVNGSGENGDKCNFTFGPDLGSTATGGYDVLINHNPYEIQPEWSNAITGCAMTYLTVAPTARFTVSPPTPEAKQVVSFDGTTSTSNDAGGYIIGYSWDFGDSSSAGTGATPTHTYAASGSYTVTLTVTDDAGKTASTPHIVVVSARPTTTTYTGPSSGNFGDSVTLTGHLVDTGTSGAISGETIGLTLGTQSCSTGPTNASGDASCSITLNQTPGSYTVKASFAGDTVYAASNSGSQPFTINKAPTMTSVGSNHPISVFGQPVTFTATVTPTADGGTVAFSDGSSVIAGCGTQPLTAGPGAVTATCTTAALSVGGSPHSITAVYSGDTDYLGSPSAPISQTVNRDPTTTTVTASPASPSTFGTRVTFTAGVTANPPGAGTPTGTVAFTIDGTPVESTTLSGGTATIATASLAAGSHTIAASYGGDGNFLASNGSLPYTVTCATTISGTHSGPLEVTASTCVKPGAVVNGSIVVHGAGALDLEGARVTGALDATGTSGVIRVCATNLGGGVDIKSATGLVILGDPGDAACAPNTISGSLVLQNNTGGVEAINNTVSGAITTPGNSGPGPFPGDPTTISGNHH